MKRLLKMIGALALLMIALVASSSCDRYRIAEVPATDSINAPTATLTMATDVTFESVQDALVFQSDLNTCHNAETVFISLSPDVVRNVSTVLLKRGKTFTLEDIIIEYDKNKTIYETLGSTQMEGYTQNTSVPKDTAMEEQPTIAPSSVSYRYEIDTVDGKPTKVLIKEERYASK